MNAKKAPKRLWCKINPDTDDHAYLWHGRTRPPGLIRRGQHVEYVRADIVRAVVQKASPRPVEPVPWTLDAALEHAAEQLPAWAHITISVEKGSAWASVYDSCGHERKDFFCTDMTLPEQVIECVQWACAKASRGEAEENEG